MEDLGNVINDIEFSGYALAELSDARDELKFLKGKMRTHDGKAHIEHAIDLLDTLVEFYGHSIEDLEDMAENIKDKTYPSRR